MQEGELSTEKIHTAMVSQTSAWISCGMSFWMKNLIAIP